MGSVLSVQEFSTANSAGSGGDDYSITVPASAEALVVTLGSKDAGSVSASLSTDGSLGTPDAETHIDLGTECYIWALASPTTGAQTLTVTTSKTARDQSVKVYYCDGVDTADLVEAVVDNVSSTGSISESITTVSGGIVIDVWAENQGTTPTAGADQTAQTRDDLDDGFYGGSYLIADAASETMSWTGFAGAAVIRYAAISLNPSTGGGGGLSIPVAAHHYRQQGIG